MGRGPGGGQSPFLRASSFCLRADEVSLIMTNLEKANQVRKPVLGGGGLILHVVGVSSQAGRKGCAQSVFIELCAIQSTEAGRCLSCWRKESEGADRILRNRMVQAAAVREGAFDPDSGVREDILEEGPWS